MPYQLMPVPMIVKFLEDSLDSPLDEKELYDMSLEIEPRERDDEKIARLLAEVSRSRVFGAEKIPKTLAFELKFPWSIVRFSVIWP